MITVYRIVEQTLQNGHTRYLLQASIEWEFAKEGPSLWTTLKWCSSLASAREYKQSYEGNVVISECVVG